MPNTKIPALPEPTAWQVVAYGRVQRLAIRADVADEVACKYREQGDPKADAEPLFTAEQMLAFREAGRVAGLEEAAAEAATHDETDTSGYDTAHQIAAAIRNLKG